MNPKDERGLVTAVLRGHVNPETAYIQDDYPADPAARKAHDAPGAVITSRGYQTIAQTFRDNAAAATAALEALQAFISPQQADLTGDG
jgi:hypothetical protein